MSCFETKIDYNFVYAVQSLAKSASEIAESLKATDQKKAYSDEQVKEIIKSYPKEDLYELLNYDQKRYINDKERKNTIISSVMDRIEENRENRDFSPYVFDGKNDKWLMNHIAIPIAERLVDNCKFDDSRSFFENIDSAIAFFADIEENK